VTIDKSTIAYAVAAIAIIGVIFFIIANMFGGQKGEKTEAVDEAKLDAAVGKGVDPSPLSQPQKD
jgi:hypothetical protein